MWRRWLGLIAGAFFGWLVGAQSARLLMLWISDRPESASAALSSAVFGVLVVGPICGVFGAVAGYRRGRRAEPARLPDWTRVPDEQYPPHD